MDFDVVTLGEAKIDIFLFLQDTSSHIDSHEEGELCFRHGDKIPVESYNIFFGGNAANVAVGLSKFSLKTAIITELGKDDFSERIIKNLISNNIDIGHVLRGESQPSLSAIINFKKERTIFSYNTPRDHNFSFDNLDTKWIYMTSLGNKWEEAYKNAVNFAQNKNVKLVFNPGELQLDAGMSAIENVFKNSEIVILNKEEAAQLLKLNAQNAEEEELLRKLKETGPKNVVITDGENGSFAIDSQGNIQRAEIIKAEVVDKTGAGDAYSSAFIAAFVLGKDIKTAMSWGAKNSASAIGKPGAQEGLLTLEQLTI